MSVPDGKQDPFHFCQTQAHRRFIVILSLITIVLRNVNSVHKHGILQSQKYSNLFFNRKVLYNHAVCKYNLAVHLNHSKSVYLKQKMKLVEYKELEFEIMDWWPPN